MILRILLVILLLCSCTEDGLKLVNSNNTKFHAGERIFVTNGFYEQCRGNVLGHSLYYDRNGKIGYIVRLRCNEIQMEDLLLPEDILVKDGM